MAGTHYDPEARQVALEGRVEALGSNFTQFRSDYQVNMAQLRSDINTAISSLSSNVNQLKEQQSAAGRPQWMILIGFASLCLVIMGGAGAILYTPMITRMEKAEALQQAIPDKYVTQTNLQERSDRTAEDRARTERALEQLREQAITKELWISRNTQIDDQIAELRRMNADVKNDLGGTYNLRDALAQLQVRLDKVEDENRALTVPRTNWRGAVQP